MDPPAIAAHEIPQAKARHEGRLAVSAGDLDKREAHAPAAIGRTPSDDLREYPELPRVELERPARGLVDEA